MRHVDLLNIKLNQIRIFLTVVEFGGFTAAAEKLNMTQPMISKTIAHLEQELGLYLFLRGSRKFQVTPAGVNLYEEWKHLIQSFEDAVLNAHSIQEGKTETLKIGTGELDPKDSPVIKKIRIMKSLLPGTDVFGECMELSALVSYLAQDKLDLIVISKHMLPLMEGLEIEWKAIIPSRLCIYVHQSNPLYDREYLDFSDLRMERFIVFSPEKDNSYIELLTALSNEAGFTPLISCYVQHEKSFTLNLELENGIVLADSYTDLESSTIKKFPLNIRNDIIAVWKKDHFRDSIKVFLNLFQTE